MFPVKTAGDFELDVLGVPFGGPEDRDSDGEYFTPATKLHLDKFPSPAVVYHHGFGDTKRPDPEPQYIGRVTSHEIKSDGVWFRVALDRAHALALRVWEAAKRGAAYASSGSIIHLVRYGRDGRILEWPLAELSIFETDTGKRPANKRAVALPVMKAVYDAVGLLLPLDIEQEPEDEATGDGTPDQSATSVTASKTETMQTQEIQEMSDNMQAAVAEAVAAALKAEREAQVAVAQAAAAEQARIDAAVKSARAEWDADAAKERRLTGGGESPYVAKFANLWAYDNTDTPDLAYAIGVLEAAKGRKPQWVGASEDARRALAVRIVESKDGEHTPVKTAMKAAGMPMKANELNHSTQTSYGDEWIGVAYSGNLWQRVVESSNVVGRIPTVEVPQGVESMIIPVQSTPPTFYKVAQATAQDSNTLGKVTYTHTSSKMGTANQTLSVGKLGARSIFAGELVEDSVIQWAAELRRAMEQEATEVLEALVIDGDTDASATTNINDIAGTPGGTETFLVLNGFRKLALVTNTANSRSATTLAAEDYLETLKLLGLAGKNAINRGAVSFIVDLHTHWKTLELTEVKTRDVFAQPTLENGLLTSIYGREVIATPNMHRANQDATYGLKANTAGKLDLDTASNNTTGAILAVRWDQWRLGWKRRIMFEVERVPQADASEIICNMRVGMIYRDTDASAISYNVTL